MRPLISQPIDLLLYFGAFDPPHLGHARAVRQALAYVQPKELQIVLLNEHCEGKDLSPVSHRKKMLELFAASIDPRVSVNTVDIDYELGGKTVETIRVMRALRPKARLGILLGSDHIESFPSWVGAAEILSEATCFFVKRDGVLTSMCRWGLRPGMVLLPSSRGSAERSATSLQIKRLLSANMTSVARRFTSPAIMDYIVRAGLYTDFFERNPSLLSRAAA